MVRVAKGSRPVRSSSGNQAACSGETLAEELDSALRTMQRGPWSTNAAESRQLRLLSLRVANGYDRAVGLRRRIEDITARKEHEAWAAAVEEDLDFSVDFSSLPFGAGVHGASSFFEMSLAVRTT